MADTEMSHVEKGEFYVSIVHSRDKKVVCLFEIDWQLRVHQTYS